MPSFDQYCQYALMNTTLQTILSETPNYTSIPWSWYINFNLCRIFLLLVYFLVIFSPILIFIHIILLVRNHSDINNKVNLTFSMIQDIQNSIQTIQTIQTTQKL
jgi:hypothetical protein